MKTASTFSVHFLHQDMHHAPGKVQLLMEKTKLCFLLLFLLCFLKQELKCFFNATSTRIVQRCNTYTRHTLEMWPDKWSAKKTARAIMKNITIALINLQF
jgi:hypothetical protein